YQPMSAEKEVMSLYSGTRGFLDSIPVEKVGQYEQQMLAFIERKYPEILAEIKEKNIISDALDQKMAAALTEFAGVFQA
ncbi:MAG: F0F1 ATP synthase subunit alpha, partial [Syntrophobacteraceae bacterium]